MEDNHKNNFLIPIGDVLMDGAFKQYQYEEVLKCLECRYALIMKGDIIEFDLNSLVMKIKECRKELDSIKKTFDMIKEMCDNKNINYLKNLGFQK